MEPRDRPSCLEGRTGMPVEEGDESPSADVIAASFQDACHGDEGAQTRRQESLSTCIRQGGADRLLDVRGAREAGEVVLEEERYTRLDAEHLEHGEAAPEAEVAHVNGDGLVWHAVAVDDRSAFGGSGHGANAPTALGAGARSIAAPPYGNGAKRAGPMESVLPVRGWRRIRGRGL